MNKNTLVTLLGLGLVGCAAEAEPTQTEDVKVQVLGGDRKAGEGTSSDDSGRSSELDEKACVALHSFGVNIKCGAFCW